MCLQNSWHPDYSETMHFIFVVHICPFIYIKAKASLGKVIERETGVIHKILVFIISHITIYTPTKTLIYTVLELTPLHWNTSGQAMKSRGYQLT